VLETALDVELTEHLGHERNERCGSGNVRNGNSHKTVRTDVGDVRITVPRDRAGSFAPAVVPKHSRRLAGFDDAVLSLYAKGLTTGDIANHLADIYGTQVSRDLVSRVTDAVVEQMQQWQNRPLDAGRFWRTLRIIVVCAVASIVAWLAVVFGHRGIGAAGR